MSNPSTDSGAAEGKTSSGAFGRGAVVLLRIVLLVLCLNTLAGVAARLGTADGLGDVVSVLGTANLGKLAIAKPSVGATLDGLRSAAAAPAGCVVAMAGALTAAILLMRPGAAVGILLALLLLNGTVRAGGSDIRGDLEQANAGLLFLALALPGVVLLMGAWRWGMLLKVQGVNLPFGMLCRMTLIGAFFSLALPGAVSGDLLKMAYVTARAPEHKAEAVLTILLDRVIGILGLFTVAAACVLVSLPMLLGLGAEDRVIQAGAFTVGLGSIGGIVAVIVVECRERLLRIPPVRALVALGERLLPAAICGIVRRLTSALDLYRGHRRTVVRTLLLSVCVHMLLGVELYVLGRAVAESNLRARDYFLTMQVANTVGAVPLTPGGVGTRDRTVVAFFHALGAAPAEKAGTIPVTYSLLMVFWSLVGAMVFVATPRLPGGSGIAGGLPDET